MWLFSHKLDNLLYNIEIMSKKSIKEVAKKLQKFTFPEHRIVIEAENIEEAQEKLEKIISKK